MKTPQQAVKKNEALYQNALEIIHEIFGDTSVSRETTAKNLLALRDDIDTMLNTLKV